MKSSRQAKIMELVNTRQIETQDELLLLLRESDFAVTQATVSRDIRELRLSKAMGTNGKYYYKVTKEPGASGFTDNLFFLFSQSVQRVDFANNMLVIKCLTGAANAVCASFDAIDWEGVLGTLAGDDTIFIVMRDEESAREMTSRLRSMLS